MKKIFLSLILFFIIYSTKAQPYESIFGKDTTFWYKPSCMVILKNAIPDSNYYIAVEDTLINGLSYKRLGSFDYWNDTIYYSLLWDIYFETTIFIREDTNSGKAWIRFIEPLNYDTLEFLFMDLSLNLGDTISLYFDLGYDNSLATVDSVYYQSGKKHVRLNYFYYSTKLFMTFIEGMGPTHTWLYNLFQMGMEYCTCVRSFYKDSILTYSNASCLDPVGINEVLEFNSSISLYPNPTHSKVEIKIENYESNNFQLSLLDLLGNEIFSGNFAGNTTQLDLEKFSKGIYLLRITNEKNNVIGTKKVSIE